MQQQPVDPPSPGEQQPPRSQEKSLHHQRGTPLVLTTAGDAETLVRANGTRFIVTNRNGDIAPAGARELGLFTDDTRYLSYYALTIRNLQLVHLSSSAFDHACNRIDLMVSGLGNEEFLDDPQNFLHVRRRQTIVRAPTSAFLEEIEIVNYLQRAVTIELDLMFHADFADVFEIRGAKRQARGTMRPAACADDHVDLSYDGLDGRRYTTRLSFRPTPKKLAEERATFLIQLAPAESTRIGVSIAIGTADTAKSVILPDFETVLTAERTAARSFIDRCTRFRCDNATIQNVLEQSTKDLRSLLVGLTHKGDRPPQQQHMVLAAGIPWFCCPFGRDTLLAAYEALTLNPDLAKSSLFTLAAFQGTKYDEVTEEEPGKIFHELRFGEMAQNKEIPHRPYYGTIDATPLFIVVAHHTYKITGDVELICELAPAISKALAWIDRRSENATKLVTYERLTRHGLENQGWKDSRAGVSYPDGRPAKAPIALAEVQGYCVDAYRRGAGLLAAIGDMKNREIYEERAKQFGALVDRLLWLPDAERYAFAIDGDGRALPTVVSNVGHLLWSRLPEDPERARATARLLVSKEQGSLSAYGVRTLAAGQPVYNPLSYHNGTVWPHDNAIIAKGCANYDLMEDACTIFESMLAAMEHFPNHRLPELFCGITNDRSSSYAPLVRYPVACSPQAWSAAAPFLLLQAVLGLHVDGVEQRILVRNPRLPTSINEIEIEGLRVGRSRVSLRLHRSGKRCHVDRLDVEGAPLRTFVEIE